MKNNKGKPNNKSKKNKEVKNKPNLTVIKGGTGIEDIDIKDLIEVVDDTKEVVSKSNKTKDMVNNRPKMQPTTEEHTDAPVATDTNRLFGLDTFEALYDRIKDTIDGSLISIKQSRYSIGFDSNSLFISGDIESKRPNLVLIPIEGKRAKLQAFYGPMYIDGEEYPSVDIDLSIGIPVLIRSFIKNGNGYGLKLEKDGTILI